MSHARTAVESVKGDEQGRKAGSIYSYNSSRDGRRFVKEMHGRVFNNLNDAYFFPTDDLEWRRLDKKHSAELVAFDGLTPCPELVASVLAPGSPSPTRILDVGCGTGSWAVEMASLYPEAEVLGIDLAPIPIDTSNMPPNLHFEIDDVNHEMSHFYDQFDLIHAKCILSGLADSVETYREIMRCLRPGGLLILVDGDRDFWDEKREKKIMMAKVNGDEDVKSVSEQGSWCQRLIWETIEASILAGSDHEPAFEYLDHGLWDEPLLDPETAGAGSVFFPVGPWARGSSITENEALKYVGILRRQGFANSHRAYHAILQRYGLNKETLEEWSKRADEELDTMKYHMWIRYRFCWARRRAGDGQPAPPLQTTTQPSQEFRRQYPAIEFYATREQAREARERRLEGVGKFPTAAVKRAAEGMRQ